MVKNKYKCSIKLLIEDNGSGTQLIQTLKAEYHISSQAIKPEYDKATRLQSVSHLIENGSCLFPNNEPHWWHDFLYELLRFPRAKHDDQCDALSQALGNKPEIARPPCRLRGRKRIDWSLPLGFVRGEFQLL